MRYKGFLDVSEAVDKANRGSYIKKPFVIDGKKYIYKKTKEQELTYNELIGEELAKDFGIDCAHYDLATYHGTNGVISEYFLQDDEKLLFGLDLIKKSFDNYFMYLTNNYNYLEFYRSKLNDEQFEYLKQLFIFDIISANSDRHEKNVAFIQDKEGNLKPAPLFDNERILDLASIKFGRYFLGVKKEDAYYMSEPNSMYVGHGHEDVLIVFIDTYGHKDEFYEKLDILSEENIKSIISRIEDRTEYEMKPNIKKLTIKRMNQNRDRVKERLDSIK